MLKLPAELISSKFQQDFDAIFDELSSDVNILKHKDEVLAIWYASPYIKRVCISQPIWLQNILADEAAAC